LWMPSIYVSLPTELYEQIRLSAERSKVKITEYVRMLLQQAANQQRFSRAILLKRRLQLLDEYEEFLKRFGKDKMKAVAQAYYSCGGPSWRKTAPTPDRIQQMEEALKKLYAQREDLKLNLEDIVNFETLLRKDLEIAEVEHTLGSE